MCTNSPQEGGRGGRGRFVQNHGQRASATQHAVCTDTVQAAHSRPLTRAAHCQLTFALLPSLPLALTHSPAVRPARRTHQIQPTTSLSIHHSIHSLVRIHTPLISQLVQTCQLVGLTGCTNDTTTRRRGASGRLTDLLISLVHSQTPLISQLPSNPAQPPTV